MPKGIPSKSKSPDSYKIKIGFETAIFPPGSA
jgi:hypothetical protein